MFEAHRTLVRRCLREARFLPDEVSREYFRSIIVSRCRRPYGKTPENIKLRIAKSVNALENLFLKLRAARSGQLSALDELLEMAFARIGPRREEFLRTYLQEPPPPDNPPLPFPSSHFPRYSPALAALLTSPISYPASNRPSTSSALRALPPTVTRVWAEFPDQEPVPVGRALGQGVVHPFRQINLRRRSKRHRIERLVGPPLGDVRTPDWAPAGASIRRAVGLNMENSLVSKGERMLDVLVRCATYKPTAEPPRWSPKRWLKDSTAPAYPSDPAKCPFRVPPPPRDFLPVQVMPSHPLYPSTPPLSDEQLDPLQDTLPPKRRPPAPDPLRPRSTSGAEKGPRILSAKTLSRRYARILDLVPSLVYEAPKPEGDSGISGKVKRPPNDPVSALERKIGIDRSFMTPDPVGGGKVVVTRPQGWQGWTESGQSGMQGGRQVPPMDDEDLLWL